VSKAKVVAKNGNGNASAEKNKGNTEIKKSKGNSSAEKSNGNTEIKKIKEPAPAAKKPPSNGALEIDLRDYFAAKVMQVLISKNDLYASHVAELAYLQADEMISRGRKK